MPKDRRPDEFLEALGGLVACQQEQYAEELLLSPLPGGLLCAHFHFSHASTFKRHYATFPKAISQMAASVQFLQLELSLTQGRWHHQLWGTPPWPDKPGGAELRASFSPQLPPSQVSHEWRALSHTLGGLFCASLNFLARPETTAQQQLVMGPSGPAASSTRQLYAALPQEAVCTENLTPWLKLLPCRDAAGLASVFKRQPLFLTGYHSLQVRIQVQRNSAGEPTALQLSQSLSLVMHPAAAAAAGALGLSAPRPGHFLPWDLAGSFGRGIDGPCPAASHSRVYVQLPKQLAEGVSAGVQPQEQQQRVQREEGEEVGPAAGSSGRGMSLAAQQLLDLPAFKLLSRGPPSPAAAAGGDDASGGGADGSGSSEQSSSSSSSDADVNTSENSSVSECPTDPAAASDGASPSAPTAGDPPSQGQQALWWERASEWQTAAYTLRPAPDAALLGYKGPCRQLQQVLLLYDVAAMHAEATRKQQQQQGSQSASGKDSSTASASSKSSGKTGKRRRRDKASSRRVELLTLGQEWPGGAAPAAAAVQGPVEQPRWLARRRTLGSGTMHGTMVLHVYRTSNTSSSSSSNGSGGSSSRAAHGSARAAGQQQGEQQGPQEGQAQGQLQQLCVMQLVPWMVRVWLHTLTVALDGKPAELATLLQRQHISLARDRARPLLLELCLALPAAASSLSLEVQFSKAFLTVFEQPPDAYRGFDVPAAIISYPEAMGQGMGGSRDKQAAAAAVGAGGGGTGETHHTGQQQRGEQQQQQQQRGGLEGAAEASGGGSCTMPGRSSSGSFTGLVWELQVAEGNPEATSSLSVLTPLLRELAQPAVPQVYSEGLLVPLAVPDFSMPYNVICLTSTVLAVFFGATLNALLRRRPKEGDASASRLERKRKLVKLALVAVVFSGLGVYLDADLQEAVRKALGLPVANGEPQGS